MSDVTSVMQAAWRPIRTAPTGSTRTVEGAKGKREIFVPDWVWTCRTSDGHVTKSHWLPDENRWNGWTAGAGPDLWQQIVVPPPPEPTP